MMMRAVTRRCSPPDALESSLKRLRSQGALPLSSVEGLEDWQSRSAVCNIISLSLNVLGLPEQHTSLMVSPLPHTNCHRHLRLQPDLEFLRRYSRPKLKRSQPSRCLKCAVSVLCAIALNMYVCGAVHCECRLRTQFAQSAGRWREFCMLLPRMIAIWAVCIAERRALGERVRTWTGQSYHCALETVSASPQTSQKPLVTRCSAGYLRRIYGACVDLDYVGHW